MAKGMFRKMLQQADDVYLTDKHIAVTTVSTSYDKRGNYEFTEKRKYIPRTKNTMAILKSEIGVVRKGK